MIKNFKEKTEGQHLNIHFQTVGVATYKIVEAWTQEYQNGDWYGVSRFKYKGYDLIDRVPPEFIVELRFHNPRLVFECTMFLQKDGQQIQHIAVDKKDVRTVFGWIEQINKLIKLAGENILDK